MQQISFDGENLWNNYKPALPSCPTGKEFY